MRNPTTTHVKAGTVAVLSHAHILLIGICAVDEGHAVGEEHDVDKRRDVDEWCGQATRGSMDEGVGK